jgi:hypothetical protein
MWIWTYSAERGLPGLPWRGGATGSLAFRSLDCLVMA